MILIIFFSIPFMLLLWFIIFRFLLKKSKHDLLTDIPKKIEKQNRIFFNDGNEVSLKEQLGLEEVIEETGEEEVKEEITEEKTEETEEEEIKEEVKEDGLD